MKSYPPWNAPSGQEGAGGEVVVLGFLPVPGWMCGAVCGNPKGGNTGQLVHTVLFSACSPWDRESSEYPCSATFFFMLRNKH